MVSLFHLLKYLKEDRKGDKMLCPVFYLYLSLFLFLPICPCPFYQTKWYVPYQFLMMTRVIRPGGTGMGSGLLQVLSDQRILGAEAPLNKIF